MPAIRWMHAETGPRRVADNDLPLACLRICIFPDCLPGGQASKADLAGQFGIDAYGAGPCVAGATTSLELELSCSKDLGRVHPFVRPHLMFSRPMASCFCDCEVHSLRPEQRSTTA